MQWTDLQQGAVGRITARYSGHELELEKLSSDIRKRIFIVRMVKEWSRLS